MASPSPVTDGKHVWAHFGTGDLACYDFDGRRVWALNLTERFGPFTIWWGHANSPCLAGDVLVCACLQDPKGGGKNYVVALDKMTGKERWFAKRETGAREEPADSYTTPILCRLGGREQVVVFGGNVLDAYDPASGKRLWQCDAFKGNRVISGPTVAGDAVYAIQGMRGPLFAVLPEPGDAKAARVLWKYPGKTPDAASPAVANGLVFMATNDGVGICVDAASGKQLWKERLADAFRATPLVAGDRVYFFGKGGEAAIVQAARTFQVLARPDLGEAIVGSPAAVGGELFLRTKGFLYRVGDGKAAGR